METYGYLNIVKEKLEGIGETIIKEMAAIIQANGAVASGRLLNSLQYDVVFDGEKFIMNVEYADYGYFVNNGRKGNRLGKFPPMQPIKEWMAYKGIPASKLWPIMVKIKNAGYYSKKTGTVKRSDGTQTTFYSQPRGIKFTSPFDRNLDLKKILKEFEDLIVAEIPKDLLEGISFKK